MEEGLWLLLGTAVGIGFIHTLVGVDHSLPFVVLGRAQGWSVKKLLAITTLCGAGHVISSIVLGFIGIGLGIAVGHLEWIEGRRGEISAWLLIGFGLTYAAWAVSRSLRKRPHRHVHFHAENSAHEHQHAHEGDHLHPHRLDRRALTVWALFVVFVLGPCEPLIPLLMVPALTYHWTAVALVAAVFGLTTVGTMVVVVLIGYYGFRPSFFGLLERHVHVVAGLMIAFSGIAIKAFGI
jgi:nickel/cobalt transporter (NicO) family protein